MQEGMPVFVKIDEYKDVLEVLKLINDKLEKAKSVLAKVNELKSKEDNELEMWEAELDDIENKLSLMNRTLLDPSL
ncbi:MAG: hypothetical protein MAG795_00364 [Candidatus Woesearchaeota archaeon]|nr:hypothetical protein [Candidatus Woesearchaeota archaeon]